MVSNMGIGTGTALFVADLFFIVKFNSLGLKVMYSHEKSKKGFSVQFFETALFFPTKILLKP